MRQAGAHLSKVVRQRQEQFDSGGDLLGSSVCSASEWARHEVLGFPAGFRTEVSCLKRIYSLRNFILFSPTYLFNGVDSIQRSPRQHRLPLC
jgi:hypothetical protein